jgi:hypothetical protein
MQPDAFLKLIEAFFWLVKEVVVTLAAVPLGLYLLIRDGVGARC